MALYKATSEGNIPLSKKEEQDIETEWSRNRALMEQRKPRRFVTMLQARLALYNAGLLDKVNIAVENAKPAVKISWEFCNKVYRDDPYLASICAMLNLTDEEIDNLFNEAEKL